ncbi:cupin domain-containing protein [Nocardia stercoris]|uniref:Cupin domain-containing protein n=1 Tax=Nocardia stercoris TaxID=2483361 RepID=A0A3M2KTL2_9NOCA|nr:cupin domain-containing protein [Nocardia stercoris]RMI28982.1 cupin domain-containing protein [Nocardia stercoris]
MSDDLPEDQPTVNRRSALGAGAAALGGAALGAGLTAAAACADTTPSTLPSASEVDANLNRSTHLFHLTAASPDRFDGGTLQGAHEQNFPVLAGQNGAAYFVRLEPGGIREPHWHPTAWELNYHISGTAKWTLLGTHPDGSYRTDVFEAHAGDLVFAPQGFFHYFENARTDAPLELLIVFNTSAPETSDDIGLLAAMNSMPRDVTASVLGVPVSALAAIPTEIKPVVITTRH